MLAGIDIGGTKMAIGIGDREGNLISKHRISMTQGLSPRQALEEAATFLEGLEHPIEAVGIGAAGPIDLEGGMLVNPPNLSGWDRVPIRSILEERLKVPVRMDNDANAAALGEYRFGAGRGCQDMVYLTVSTGVGGGIIIGGELLHGVRNGAGEVGHMTILPDGPRCGCGNYGCLEALASGTGIARRAQEGLDQGVESILRGQTISTHTIAEAVRARDPFAMRVWDEAIGYLAIGIANLVAVLAPQRIVIGGGVANVGELLFVPLREKLSQRVCMVPLDAIEIVAAKHINDAGLLGAIALAW